MEEICPITGSLMKREATRDFSLKGGFGDTNVPLINASVYNF